VMKFVEGHVGVLELGVKHHKLNLKLNLKGHTYFNISVRG
jgi:hypothetical protein